VSIARTVDLESARAAAALHLPQQPELAQHASAAAATAAPAADAAPEPSAAELREQRAMLVAAVRILLDKGAQSLALRWGEHWKMDAAESESIAAPLVEIIEREFGTLANTPESRLLLAVGLYAAPRMLMQMSATSAPSGPATPHAAADSITVAGERVA
jgi:hypothetical protein